MAWEEFVKEILAVVFSIAFTLILIVVGRGDGIMGVSTNLPMPSAWMIMWHLFFSKIRFVREIIFPDSDGKTNDPHKKEELRSRREKRQRKDS